MSTATPHLPDAINYLKHVVEPGTVVELRILGCVDDLKYPPFTVSGYFDHDHLDELAGAAISWTRKADACYVTINPVDSDLLARAANRVRMRPKETTKDAEIVRRTGIVFDFDPARPAGVSATSDERASALDRLCEVMQALTERGWPEPLMSDSGNGGHARYKVNLPNTPESLDLVKRVLEAADKRFSDEIVKVDVSLSNASRIIKLPGTLARKGDSTPTRPHRLSRVLSIPDSFDMVTIDQLEAFANEHKPIPVPISKPVSTCVARTTFGGPTPETRARAYLFSPGFPDAVEGAYGHKRLYHAASVLVDDFGLTREQAEPIFREWNSLKALPPESEVQVVHKLDDAIKNHPVPSCRLLNAEARPNRDLATRSQPSMNPHTDTGNAERMVARHGGALRHCHPWKKWLHFDGCRWAPDETAAIRRMAKTTARSILAEASTVEDKERREAIIRWARATESQSHLNSMIALASIEEGVPVLPKELNTDPWLLNVRNGTIDLRTGELRPSRPSDLITTLAPVEFHREALCPLWDATLDRFFGGNPGLIAFWDRLCGIALTGDISEQILPILHGSGDNGKSTMVGALLGLLGPDYAAIAPPGLLMARRGDSHPTERVFLFGKRLVVDMESQEGARLNESLIKQLTGSDPITARAMNQDFWTFQPTHKLWLCTNHKPVIRGTDHAIWRRPKLVPFSVAIPEAEKIGNFPTVLKAEYPGILARAIRGCLDWQKNGLAVPEEVSAATKDYRVEQDVLGDFIAEEMTIDRSLRVKASEAYKRYRTRTQHSGEEPMSLMRFGLAMTDRGFTRKENHGIWYLGIGLRPDPADDNRF